jgi:tetratricopeptide (TPR) repeat protein
MVPRVPEFRSRWAIVVAVVLLALGRGAREGGAQELPLREEYPGSQQFACPAWSAPAPAPPEAAREARALASEASDAVVLGELDRAESFLARALQLDPGAADLLYRHARVLEAREDRAGAISGFCRALAAGSGTEEVSDAQARLESLVELDRPQLSPEAVAAFDRGVSMARMERYAAAEAAFETAVREQPDWPPAVYNVGVVSARRGDRDKAVEHLRRYLTLAPDAPDVADVARTLGRWEVVPEERRLADPGATLALGMFIPGTGQFYSGRTWPGVAVLAAATGAVAAGFLVREVRVRCVGVADSGGSCPPEQVVGRQTSRPHLGLALAVAAGVTIGGAVEAFLHARSDRGSPPSGFVASASGGDIILYSMRAP